MLREQKRKTQMTRADELAAQNAQHTLSKMHSRMQTIHGTLRPLKDKILVRNLQFGETVTKSGLIILDDDGKERGIHPRWAQVWKMGNDVDEDIELGDWILIEHGRWTRTIEVHEEDEKIKVNMIDPECILLVTAKFPL